ncbi:hypothetical protein [Paraburkholderia rhynchosiae]|uniref:Uncharacterized protein n=1 Tax=Paraburkholderia rhynchosiae TaxID=487049 RepID=A0A2N7VXQ2_9BURK|nr:hypothetical protein [Paraburkholderia rhynchosiae]PMS21942.1 hypothetical protein C0Z16_33390 [Paraburkholderia rhynchosiae]CAB3738892.1 hypothetical protein LMG27174_06502 [Paraburkholderia rhynchosiae]
MLTAKLAPAWWKGLEAGMRPCGQFSDVPAHVMQLEWGWSKPFDHISVRNLKLRNNVVSRSEELRCSKHFEGAILNRRDNARQATGRSSSAHRADARSGNHRLLIEPY